MINKYDQISRASHYESGSWSPNIGSKGESKTEVLVVKDNAGCFVV